MTEQEIVDKMTEILNSDYSENQCIKKHMGTGMFLEDKYRLYRIYEKNGFEFFIYFIPNNITGGAVTHSLIPGIWYSTQIQK